MPFSATWDSVSSHPLPHWYEDAKLGVFLHWGLYSVPGWAPQGPDITTIMREHRPSWLLRNIPYAEWYVNTLRIAGSPTQRHHEETYGAGFPYDGFRTEFEGSSERADLESLARLCRDAGARYVVLTTKHSEGYCLWPTSEPHPVKGEYHSRRDLVGDLSRAVVAENMRMGLYYCGGYDWSYNGAVLASLSDILLGGPKGADYARYAESHLLDLIERYQPSILWNDIGWPSESDLPALLATYYNTVDDGVVNDRWYQGRRSRTRDALVRGVSAVAEGLWPVLPAAVKRVVVLPGRHADFATHEYTVPSRQPEKKWEATRGIGHSFGANRNETEDDILSTEELVHLLMDVVAKNGNLLIGVGPTPDGQIPEIQSEPLLGLGRWLGVNGEAVYGTRPWTVTSGSCSSGKSVRFTADRDALYATLLGNPSSNEVVISGLRVGARGGSEERSGVPGDFEARVLGSSEARCHVRADGRLSVDFGAGVGAPEGPAHVVRISPRSVCAPDT